MAGMDYSGKHVVVTGGATGVGAGLLEVLAELGAPRVTVLDIKQPEGPHDTYIETNLANRAAIDAAVAKIEAPVFAREATARPLLFSLPSATKRLGPRRR